MAARNGAARTVADPVSGSPAWVPGRRDRCRRESGPRAHFFFVYGSLRQPDGRWRNDAVSEATTDRLTRLLEPGAAALGFELIAVEFGGSGGNRVLRVYIDGPDGVTVDDCERVSRQVSAILDVEDPVPGRYTLEVSSPGLDRPLVKPRHFEQVVGEEIKVRIREPLEGRRRFRGRLQAVRDGVLEMEVDGQTCRLPISDVEKARLVASV